jgi:hypothetical protein
LRRRIYSAHERIEKIEVLPSNTLALTKLNGSQLDRGIWHPAADFARTTYLPEGFMRRLPVALVPAAVGLLLAACVADRDTTSPRSAPDAAAFAQGAQPQTCSPNTFSGTMKQSAGTFFSAGNDPVFDLISTMKTSWQTNGAAAAATTTAGLNILARIAAVRLTSEQVLSPPSKFEAAEVAGGNLVYTVALCMTLGSVDAATATKALRTGVFELRGGTAPTVNPADPTGPAIAKPDVYPRWGVEPKTPGAWSSAYPRYLVYGVPGADLSELGHENPAVSTFNGFDVASLPADFLKSSLRVGMCVNALIGNQATNTRTGANLLIHLGVIEPNSSPTATFCENAPSPPSASLSTSKWFASIANRLSSVFTPASAFAGDDDLRFDSFTGGGPSSWSPHVFAQFPGSDIVLRFSTQPVDGFIYPATLKKFVVHAESALNPDHYFNGVEVTLRVANNSGLPAGACAHGTLKVTTTGLGDASFEDISILKAGGYTITADGSYSGITTLSKVSALFNIKNKGGTGLTC